MLKLYYITKNYYMLYFEYKIKYMHDICDVMSAHIVNLFCYFDLIGMRFTRDRESSGTHLKSRW